MFFGFEKGLSLLYCIHVMEFFKKLSQQALSNVWAVFVLGLLANSISWLIIRFQIRPTADLVSLHYTIFYTDVKGPGYYLYAIPAIGLAMLLFNMFLCTLLRRREIFAGKILIAVAAIAQIFILLAVLFLKSVILI